MTAEPALRRSSGALSGGFARQPDSLADVLERVLDKGIVIAGDIVVSILDIELLTLKVRLFVSSADTAREMGLDWWSRDPFFTGEQARADSGSDRSGEIEALQQRIAALEDELRRHRPELAAEPREAER
jgi:HAMP domain-containing protein